MLIQGVGVFPPRVNYTEPGAVYQLLPLVKDREEEEIERNRGKKKKKGDLDGVERVGIFGCRINVFNV